MPTYYATEFGLDVGRSAALSVLPWGLNIVCANVAGYVGDKVCFRVSWVQQLVVFDTAQSASFPSISASFHTCANDEGSFSMVVVMLFLYHQLI